VAIHPLRRPLGAIAILAVVGIAMVVGVGWSGWNPSVAAAPTNSPASPSQSSSTSSPAAEPATTPPSGPTPSTSPPVGVAIVPVTSFRAPWDTTDPAEVGAILGGSSARYASIAGVAADLEPVLAALAVARPAVASRLVVAKDAAALRADLAAHPKRLGFIRASEVDPSVRALSWGGVALFGVNRVATVADWPLTIPKPGGGPGAALTYDPATAWTLVAGGDINLDGAVADHVKRLGLGVDFPFDGGTARITSHYCCSWMGNVLPRAERTGNAGAVRELLAGADLSIANFENPAPDDFVYHPGGYRFSADPALIEGVANAGIDWVSLANNHIRDYGGPAVLETMKSLDAWGIAHGGAGANLAEARAPSLLEAKGVKVAILAYDTIRPAYAAGPDRPGSNQMSVARVTADVATARNAGADVVIVFPHWGVEYTANPTALQRRLAHAAIDAGADIVIGNHPHWAGAVEIYRGAPTFYALGDFVFNIDRSEMTQEGTTLELTYEGSRLVQVRMRPYLILDGSQPNFLDPAASGKVVMDQVFGASRRLLPW
jgi:poly-gamma-glutamate capsule biosynthesis protein CapA/YwtB (metallophosphatase superfamily)